MGNIFAKRLWKKNTIQTFLVPKSFGAPFFSCWVLLRIFAWYGAAGRGVHVAVQSIASIVPHGPTSRPVSCHDCK